MTTQISDGTIFREFLDALQGFAGGNTSWNVGSVRARRTEVQYCFGLNFVLPAKELSTVKRRNYVVVSALIYIRADLAFGREPFILVISDSSALDRIVRDAVGWAESERFEHYVSSFQNYIARISTKGFSGILLALEHRVGIQCSPGRLSGADIVKIRYWASGIYASPGAFPDDHESAGAEILSEIDDLSRSLRLNAEAMALLQSVPDEGRQDKIFVGAAYEIDSFDDKARIEDLNHYFKLMMSRSEGLKKTMLDLKAEVSLTTR